MKLLGGATWQQRADVVDQDAVERASQIGRAALAAHLSVKKTILQVLFQGYMGL